MEHKITEVFDDFNGFTIENVDYNVNFAKYIPSDSYRRPDRTYRPLSFGFKNYSVILNSYKRLELDSIGTIYFNSNCLELIPTALPAYKKQGIFRKLKPNGNCTVFENYQVKNNSVGTEIGTIFFEKDLLDVVTKVQIELTDGVQLIFWGQMRFKHY